MRLFSSFFLVAEALGALGFWALVWRDPAVAYWFLPSDVSPELIRTFLVADLLTFVLLPLACGHGIFHRCRWTARTLACMRAWQAWQGPQLQGSSASSTALRGTMRPKTRGSASGGYVAL